MTWNPDSPFAASAAVGETDCGARNLPEFLCSQLEAGPVLVLGASEVALAAARQHDVVVVDWNRRRLAELDRAARERGLEIRPVCRDPDRQELGLAHRSVRSAVCVDVLECCRSDVGVLERVHRVLAPGGRLVVRVRSGPWVREEAGRGPRAPRTYDPESLRDALEEASFRMLQLRHWNFLGVPSAIVWDRWLNRPHRDTGGVPASERPRHWWDSAFDLWYRAVESRVGFPVGVSLVAVATPHLEKARVRTEARDRGLLQRTAREAYEPMATTR